MNLIIEQLQNDHHQLVRVLYHLDKELKALHGIGKSRGSLDTIFEQLDYIQTYPEIWHHPAEDLITQMLLQKAIPESAHLEECMEEHHVLELLTENLYSYLEQWVAGDNRILARLIKAGSDYVQRQLKHMEQEQQYLFPLMQRYLEAEDWAQIKAQIQSFTRITQDERYRHYQSVYRGISEESAITAR